MIKRFFIRYKYPVVLGAFVVWMTFFDKNNWWDIYRLKQTYNQTLEERDYYKEQAEMARQEYNALFSNNDSLEKFAREKYLMKRDNEDIFVILKKEE